MSEIPGDLKFMRSHEWARLGEDNRVTVGISEHAQEQLGDLVYVELPQVGDQFEQGASSAVLESVKAASDIYAPVSGTVLEVNEALVDTPDTINDDAWGEGWLYVMKADDVSQLDDLLGPDDYADFVEGEED